MKYVQALLENAETQNLLHENAEIMNEAADVMGNFYGILQNYVQDHLVDFLDENLTETSKNIYTFAAFATKQMLTEISTVCGNKIHQNEVLKEAARTEFI